MARRFLAKRILLEICRRLLSLSIVMSDHCLIGAVPVLVPYLCPFCRVVHLRLFCYTLDCQKRKPDLVSLNVKLAWQTIHKLRLGPGKESQPVLIPHCSFQHELFCKRDLGLSAGLFMTVKSSNPTKFFIHLSLIFFTGTHPSQTVQSHPCVHSLRIVS